MIFGQLTDIAGSSVIELPAVKDSNELQQLLMEKYPSLAHTKYRVAVNKKLISENVAITEGSVIALLPPFSGG